MSVTYTIGSLADLAAEYRRRAAVFRSRAKATVMARHAHYLKIEATLLETLAQELEMTTIAPKEEKQNGE